MHTHYTRHTHYTHHTRPSRLSALYWLTIGSAIVSIGSPLNAIADETDNDTVLIPASGGLGAKLPDIAIRFTRALEQVARRHDIFPQVTDASRDDVFAIAGCNSDDDPCHQAVLRTLGANRLILIHVIPGSGTTIADVELVLASRGKPSTRLNLVLTGTTTERLVDEFTAKSPPLFGGVAKREPDPSANQNPIPSQDPSEPALANQNELERNEGRPFSAPTGEPNINAHESASPSPEQNTPQAATTPPTNNQADPTNDAYYDFSRVRPLAWAVGGTGAGLVLTSFVFYGLASAKQGDVNSARANTAADLAHLRNLESSGKTLNAVGNTAFFLGLVGLGVGGYLIYRDATTPSEASSSSVSVAPILIPNGFAVGLEVRR